MSNTVWYEQVDIALIKLIHKVFGEDMKVRFRGEDDFTDNSLPYVAIQHLIVILKTVLEKKNKKDLPKYLKIYLIEVVM